MMSIFDTMATEAPKTASDYRDFGDDLMLADRPTTVTTQAELAASQAEMPAPFDVARTDGFMPGFGDASFMPGIGDDGFMPGFGACNGCGGVGMLDLATTKGKLMTAGLVVAGVMLFKKLKRKGRRR